MEHAIEFTLDIVTIVGCAIASVCQYDLLFRNKTILTQSDKNIGVGIEFFLLFVAAGTIVKIMVRIEHQEEKRKVQNIEPPKKRNDERASPKNKDILYVPRVHGKYIRLFNVVDRALLNSIYWSEDVHYNKQKSKDGMICVSVREPKVREIQAFLNEMIIGHTVIVKPLVLIPLVSYCRIEEDGKDI